MPATCCDARILSNEPVTEQIRLMRVEYPRAPRAGQFFMLRGWAEDAPPLLSRPISVHDYDEGTHTLSFLYELRGDGTRKLAALQSGETVRLTGPSGNGFPTDKLHGHIAVAGGGIGIAPLLYLCRALRAQGCTVDFFAGFRDTAYALEAFQAVCDSVSVATESGAQGVKGFVTALFKAGEYDAVCTCGPDVMMQNVARMCFAAKTPVYVSKETVMACGLGACLGCTCKGTDGAMHSVCKDGPVFEGRVMYGDA